MLDAVIDSRTSGTLNEDYDATRDIMRDGVGLVTAYLRNRDLYVLYDDAPRDCGTRYIAFNRADEVND